ncbi:MAG: nucleotidyltransferase family protein [Dehalococcoidia bacterium]|nr:nucleotidyltransferase family protein [Dehalococcoidia bacterium]
MYALIIAGGEGERLRPLTSDRPKPMIEVAGRPILEYQVDWLRAGGVTDVVFLCGYKAQVIREHFGDGSRFGIRAQYSLEEQPLGRGGALRRGYTLAPPQEQLIIGCNGDTLTNQPLAELIAYHRAKDAVATVMLAPLRSPFGIVTVEEDGRISAFQEKPVLPYWINAGIYALDRAFFARLPEKGDHEATTFPELAAEGKLFGFKSNAYWRPVDSIKDLNEAERELAQLTT